MRFSSLGALSFLSFAVVTACSSSDGASPEGDPSVTQDGGTVDSSSCKDGKKDGDETDVDCGGSCSAKCATKQQCKLDGDCTTDLKCIQSTCSPTTANNGKKDGNETDVDCGGDAPPCADGKNCSIAHDCTSQICKGNVCQAPSSTDGIKNGTETDVDCGGGAPTNAPACATGKACATHDDCVSQACSEGHVCIDSKSCVKHFGGDTCGANGNESCCGSIAVPTANNVKLDKYSITAGRMRAFIERVNGDVRGWVEKNPPSWWKANWNQYLPKQLSGGGDYDSVSIQLGAYQYPPSLDPNGDANRGCSIGTASGKIGARTYWLSPDDLKETQTVQLYSQEELDQRAMNCVSAYMVAAFCAWDGGRLPTRAELDAAWGTKTYPWGNTPNPASWVYALDSQQTAQNGDTLYVPKGQIVEQPSNQNKCTYTGPNGSCDPLRANVYYNYWGGLTKQGNDYSLYIAPPGRFPTGNGPYGHADLAGLVFNVTTIDGSNKTLWSKNGSWQGHEIPYKDTASKPAYYKYWATGGRCAR